MDGLTASMQRETRSSLRAFTLIEAVCVLVIMAALVGVAAPRYAASLERYRLDLAARRIVSDLAYAKTHARRTSTTVKLTFDTSTDRVLGTGLPQPGKPGESYSLSLGDDPFLVGFSGVDLGGDVAIVFNGYGDPDSGGQIKLIAGSRELIIDVDPTTGQGVIQ
ncbi:MAG: hypothetical protein RIG82_06350 [Phycisphaeraceae bacterium]